MLPALGAYAVDDLSPQNIERLHRSLRETPTTANRVIAVCSAMLNFAKRNRVISDNPALGVEKFPEKQRKRYLTNEELASLGEVLTQAEANGEFQAGVDCVKFLLLSGLRRGEAQTMLWSYVDFPRGWISLPDSKTGAKDVPLGPPAVELLYTIKDRQSNEGSYSEDGHVFPGKRGPIVGLPKMWLRWREAAGLENVRLHDLRHSFGSVGASSGNSLVVLGGILGHKSTATTQRYAHLQDDPAKSAANQISETISAAMGLGARRGTDD